MKSFIQFIIPVLLIFIVGGIMMFMVMPRNETRRLYIACNDSPLNRRNRFTVVATDIVTFMGNHELCELIMEVGNIGERYIRLRTPYLYHLNIAGERERNPRNEVFVSIDEDVVLYSLDGETKFTFRFR